MKYKNKNYFIAVFKVYIMLLFMQISIQLDAQVYRKIKFPERMLGFHAGYSHHQSQSIGGFNFGINHEISINKKSISTMIFHSPSTQEKRTHMMGHYPILLPSPQPIPISGALR